MLTPSIAHMEWSEVKWWMSFKTHPRRRQIKQAAQQKHDWGQRTNVKGRQINKLSMQRLAACVGKYYFMQNIWKAHHGLIMIQQTSTIEFPCLAFHISHNLSSYHQSSYLGKPVRDNCSSVTESGCKHRVRTEYCMDWCLKQSQVLLIAEPYSSRATGPNSRLYKDCSIY